jgi:hypothetical protein
MYRWSGSVLPTPWRRKTATAAKDWPNGRGKNIRRDWKQQEIGKPISWAILKSCASALKKINS